MRNQIVCDLPHRANGIQTQAYRRLGCRPDWTNDLWLHQTPEVGHHVLCRDVHLQKELFVVKRLEILNIRPRFAVSPFLRSNHFFVVAVAGQIPATTSTGDGSKACLYQAISRLQATPLSKKFEISMVEDIL